MEVSSDANNESNRFRELLKQIMDEDKLVYLNIKNSMTAIKEGDLSWQAPFTIALYALGLLLRNINVYEGKMNHPALLDLVFFLSLEILSDSKDLDLVEPAYESIEPLYRKLSDEEKLSEADTQTLFHTSLALRTLLLLKGEEERTKSIIRTNLKTDTVGAMQIAEVLFAIVLQAYYVERQDYDSAFRLLTEALSSNSPGNFSEGLMEAVPDLVELFAVKCETINDAEDWVCLFDRVSDVIEVCGEADISGVHPSNNKVTSPQFLAWKFGNLIARYALRNKADLSGKNYKIISNGWKDKKTSIKLFDYGGLGDDWLNGTLVAAILLEYNENRNWHSLREQYLSMWDSLPRYKWTSLSEAGTNNDLYWAVKIGFAEALIDPDSIKPKIEPIDLEKSLNPKLQEDLKEVLSTKSPEEKLFEKFREMMDISVKDNLSPIKSAMGEEIKKLRDGDSQQNLLTTQQKLVDKYGDWIRQLANPGSLTNAEYLFDSLNQNELSWGESIVGYSNAIEAELRKRFLEPLVKFMVSQKTKSIDFGDRRIIIDMSIDLEQIERLLHGIKSHPLLKSFIAGYDIDIEFLSNRLPNDLEIIRKYRNPSAHGNIVSNSSIGRQIQKSVLGTPQRPGILKLIFDINFHSDS
ncbi:MAG: hypothetical protein WC562_05360 [Dehalococcoidia bacterium]